MDCLKDLREVKVKNCETCLHFRWADEVCFKRGFVWGLPDSHEPIWELSLKEAHDSAENVFRFYDLKWEGNAHLIKKEIPSQSSRKKEKIPSEIRWAVWERDNFTCQYCDTRKFLSIDHIYPESLGGALEISNLQTLCRACNSRKGNRTD